MKRIGVTFLIGVAAIIAPTAAAEQLHSNVVSWTPNDAQPGEVAVLLQLYVAGPSPFPKDGKPVAGVNNVQVIIRSEAQTRRFGTEDIGGGRYRMQIIFPKEGSWDLRVRYGGRQLRRR